MEPAFSGMAYLLRDSRSIHASFWALILSPLRSSIGRVWDSSIPACFSI